MKESIKLICITAIFLLSGSDLYSTPLNGTYTIGSGGNYPTINSAFSNASAMSINGAVIFKIISGIYNEEVVIGPIPGSSSVNTVTLRSQSGNSMDVTINGFTNIFNINSKNIIIENITFGNSASNILISNGVNIKFSNNNFNNISIIIPYSSTNSDFSITGNNNIGNIDFQGDNNNFTTRDIDISDNTINGFINLTHCERVLIKQNTINSGIRGLYFLSEIIGNKIFGDIYGGGFKMYNNTILGTISVGSSYSNIYFNTIIGGSGDVATITYLEKTFMTLLNNIVINPEGGTTLYTYSYILLSSDYNDFYNGGNTDLIKLNGSSFNNVSDFYNSTGFDEHSVSQPVYFQSMTDLHLAGSSIGDEKLAGIPNTLVPDDIDGQLRSPLHPYKGADEIVDFPLPVELSSFTSSVNSNNVLLNWTTSSETNNSGFNIERAIDNGQLTMDNWIKIGNVEGNGTSNEPKEYTFTDKNLSSGKYKYRLKQIDYNGNFEYYDLPEEVVIGVPEKFSLSQNYPNPFNPTTNLEFGIPDLGLVTLKLYDISGKEVATLVNEVRSAGRYQIKFDGSNFASGVYFYKITTGSFSAVKRIILIK